jgi:hypothetical protein
MVCEHLVALETELAAMGVKETFRGQAWSKNCREWVYFDCYLDRESLRDRIPFDPCVLDHDHLGTHDGQEAGFVCEIHKDAIMGVHEAHRSGKETVS